MIPFLSTTTNGSIPEVAYATALLEELPGLNSRTMAASDKATLAEVQFALIRLSELCVELDHDNRRLRRIDRRP